MASVKDLFGGPSQGEKRPRTSGASAKLSPNQKRALLAVVALTRGSRDAWAFSRDVCARTGQHVRGCAVTLQSLHAVGLCERLLVGHAYAYRPTPMVIEALGSMKPSP